MGGCGAGSSGEDWPSEGPADTTARGRHATMSGIEVRQHMTNLPILRTDPFRDALSTLQAYHPAVAGPSLNQLINRRQQRGSAGQALQRKELCILGRGFPGLGVWRDRRQAAEPKEKYGANQYHREAHRGRYRQAESVRGIIDADVLQNQARPGISHKPSRKHDPMPAAYAEQPSQKERCEECVDGRIPLRGVDLQRPCLLGQRIHF